MDMDSAYSQLEERAKGIVDIDDDEHAPARAQKGVKVSAEREHVVGGEAW